MNNYEFLKTLSLEDLADFYCYIHDDNCKECPFRGECHTEKGKGSGVKKWLMQKHIVDKKGW